MPMSRVIFAIVCLFLHSVCVHALSPIVFSPCSWDLYDHVAREWNSIHPNTPVPELECAQVQVPLDWSTTDGDGTYYVRRLSYQNYRQDSADATSQFWLFTGGPGILCHHFCLSLPQILSFYFYLNLIDLIIHIYILLSLCIT
jgi:hypothetical protein